MLKYIVYFVFFAYALGMVRVGHVDEWEQWKLDNGKKYIVEEEANRRMVWEENLRIVTKHNYEYDLGKHTYRLGMNKFADLTNGEFKEMYLRTKKSLKKTECTKSGSDVPMSSLPGAVDWREKGYVTPVKNQKQCGSCWAFSTTGSVEGQHFKATGELVSLSEQNLVDCSDREGDLGCAGGLMDYAFDYIIDNKGIDTEESYPYEAIQKDCRFNNSNIGATISSCVDLPSEDEMALKNAVASVGPISVAIDASHISFQLYSTGVYYEPQCSETVLDHGVLAVGYGSMDGKDYWLVKNSWGADWGKNKGYIYMSRNRNNNCGISTSASYPVV